MTVAEKLFLGLGKESLTPEELDALNYATAAGQADVPTSPDERPFHIETALSQGKQPIPWYAQIERRTRG